MNTIAAPFPWFGGKSGACEQVWAAFGAVDNYVEPFSGSAVTLIGIKPGTGKFAVATGTLTRSKTIALSLVAEADRVYA